MPSREGCRVFVGNLPGQVRERDIDRFFEKYGRVRNIFVKNGRYGFCEFDDYRDADDAVHDLNGRELLGVRVTVEHARGPRRDRFGDRQRRPWVDRYGAPKRTDYRLIVENLSSKVSWQDLKDLMRRAGDVSYANAHNNRRNEGVVEFVSRGDMERAFDKYDDYEFHGKRIKLVKDRCRSASRSRDSRSKSRSRSTSRSARYRSKSRSRSRSRSRSGSRSRSVEKARERSKSASGSRSRSVSKSSNRSSSPRKEKVEDDVQMEEKEREEEEEEETVEKASKSPKEENEEEAENDIEKGRTLKQEKEPEELEAKEESKG